MTPLDYLRDRGFADATIARVGWRLEPIGPRTGRYGLPVDAATAHAWFIPYSKNGQPAFERLRLIIEEDVERFGGGKYRQPAGRPLALYDFDGWLDRDGPLDRVVLIEGEANAVALAEMIPGLPVIGMPGQQALTSETAQALAHAQRVTIWIDEADPGAQQALERIVESLHAAGVADVRFVHGAGDQDANDLLRDREDAAKVAQALLHDAQPYPAAPLHAASHQDASELLDQVRGFVARFVRLPSEHAATAVALFVLHTWAFEAAPATPYLLVQSAEKRSGKTRLLELLELVCRNPIRAASVSEAALYQAVEAWQPTLLIDEIDTVFGGSSERTEPIRGVINSGNRPGGKALRGNKDGEPRTYSTYCPKVLAGIDSGKLPDTIRDRCVVVAMQRKLTTEAVARLRVRTVQTEVAELTADLNAWAIALRDELASAYPDLPDTVDDRLAEAWEPLLAIADLAGGPWPTAARQAAAALAAKVADDDASYGVRALAAIRTAFADCTAMPTEALVEAINQRDDLPFGDWRNREGLNGRALAKLVKPYGARPKSIRIGDNPNRKGYHRAQFEDAWARYLPPPTTANLRVTPSGAATSATTHAQSQHRAIPVRHTAKAVADDVGAENPHGTRDVADVAATSADACSRDREPTVATVTGNGQPVLATAEEEAWNPRLSERHGHDADGGERWDDAG